MHFYDRAFPNPWAPEFLLWNEGGEGGGSGDGEGGEGAEGGAEGGEGGGDESRTFTQADLDRIVQDRVARERKKYEGHAELAKKAKAFDELQEAQKSELEKAEARAAKAEADAAEAVAKANARLVESAIVAEASKQGASNPALVRKLIETDAVTVGDDGQVAGVEDAVKALLADNPELVGAGSAKPGAADQGARGGGAKQLTSTAGMTPQEIVQARKDGRLDKLLGA
jgi:hypothetical protein